MVLVVSKFINKTAQLYNTYSITSALYYVMLAGTREYNSVVPNTDKGRNYLPFLYTLRKYIIDSMFYTGYCGPCKSQP